MQGGLQWWKYVRILPKFMNNAITTIFSFSAIYNKPKPLLTPKRMWCSRVGRYCTTRHTLHDRNLGENAHTLKKQRFFLCKSERLVTARERKFEREKEQLHNVWWGTVFLLLTKCLLCISRACPWGTWILVPTLWWLYVCTLTKRIVYAWMFAMHKQTKRKVGNGKRRIDNINPIQTGRECVLNFSMCKQKDWQFRSFLRPPSHFLHILLKLNEG